MNEHPILFSGPMVQAILDGRKTQTRRVVKGVDGGDKFLEFGIYSKALFTDNILNTVTGKPHDFLVKCPYGLPGDTLWVRETWQAQEMDGRWWHEIKDHRELYNWVWTNPVQPAYEATPPRWLPGIHMPRGACRIFLEIVNVRVERVQDILTRAKENETASMWDEFFAEGIPQSVEWNGKGGVPTPASAFIDLWNKINGSRGPENDPAAFSWERNPWVWVIEFKKVPL